MNTEYCPRPILLYRPWPLRLLDAATEWAAVVARQFRAWRIARAELRSAERAERELARLSLHTLQDIGAPQGLIGQRRWQEEQDDTQWMFGLQRRG